MAIVLDIVELALLGVTPTLVLAARKLRSRYFRPSTAATAPTAVALAIQALRGFDDRPWGPLFWLAVSLAIVLWGVHEYMREGLDWPSHAPEPTPVEEPAAADPPAPATDRTAKENRAIGLLIAQQDRINVSAIAREIGVSATTLRGWPRFRAALGEQSRRYQREPKRGVRDPRTGDIDAIDE